MDPTTGDQAEQRDRDMAVEELKQLQAIIARHEEHTFKIRNWFYLLLGGLVVAIYGGKFAASWWAVVLAVGGLGVTLAVLTTHIEVYHRVLIRKAIRRVDAVEAYLRSEPPVAKYEGPRVSYSLVQQSSWADWCAEFRRPMVRVHFIMTLIAVVVLTTICWLCAVPPAGNSASGRGLNVGSAGPASP